MPAENRMTSTVAVIVCVLIAMSSGGSQGKEADPPPAVFREGARMLFQGDSISDCAPFDFQERDTT